MRRAEPLRWGVIGLGIGRQHVDTIMESSNSTLVAICDKSPEALSATAASLDGVARFTRDLDLISSGTVDGVVIATNDADHATTVIAALNAGIHVFCEKPLATSREQLDRVVAALNANQSTRLTTNTLLRRSPRFVWLKEAVVSGELGDIFHAEFTYLYGRLSKVLKGWRGDDPDYSVTLGGTIHLIDLLMWLVDERPQRLVGMGGSLGTRKSPLRDPDTRLIQDLRVGLLQFPSGMTAAVSANYACVLPHFHRAEVYGTCGTFMNLPPAGLDPADSAACYYSSRDPEEPPLRLHLPYPAVPKGILIPRFVDTIFGGETEISEQESVDAVAVALAVDEAVLSGESVQVTYPSVLPRKSLD